MKRSQAKKILDAIIHRFGEETAAVRFESMLSVSSFKDAHRALTNRVGALKELPNEIRKRTGLPAFRKMWTAVPAIDVTKSPPTSVAIGAKAAQDEQLIEVSIEHFNRENLWLLVSAFEAFERFYKALYGALGYLDRNLWSCSDFGKTRIHEIGSKDLHWFQQQARNAIGKHSIDDILKTLRNSFPEFTHAESAEPINLKMWVDVAGLFRHAIVHSQGRIAKEELTKKLEEKTGFSLTGAKDSVARRKHMLFSYVRLAGDYYELQGINREQLGPPYHQMNGPTNSLVKKLSSHACLGYTVGMAHFGHKPFWERENRGTPH